MREEFKVLRQYSGEMRDGIDMTREKLIRVRWLLFLCDEMRERSREEEGILESTHHWWVERTAELEANSAFLSIPENAIHKEEFLKLKDLIKEMGNSDQIPNKRMSEIYEYIECCNHLKESTWQINLFKVAQMLWLDITRERQSKTETKAIIKIERRSLKITRDDRKFLKSLRIMDDFENQKH